MSEFTSFPSGGVLPAELWQIILEEAIYVPIYFNLNPETTYRSTYHPLCFSQQHYWASERLRNTLRRVCRSWDAFLKRYNHRYVDTADIILGLVPVTALPSAFRIRLSDAFTMTPVIRRLSLDGYDLTPKMIDSTEDGIPTTWNLRILEFSSLPPDNEFLLEQNRVYNLQSIICAPMSFLKSLSDLQVQPTVVWNFADDFPNGPSALSNSFLSKINTLYLELDTEWLPTNLPALRYLHVDLADLSVERLVEWLEIIGKQLQEFYCSGRRRESELPRSIWELCPSMKIHKAPWGMIQMPAPREHPVHTLQFEVDYLINDSILVCLECGQVHDVLVSVGASIEEHAASGIRTLAYCQTWSVLRTPSFSHGGFTSNVICLVKQANRHGIQVMDATWTSFEDHIVSEIEGCRRG